MITLLNFFIFLFLQLNIETALAKQIYVRPLSMNPGKLDISLVPNESSAFIFTNIYETLFRHGENGDISGVLANTWRVLEGGKVLEISLKNDSYFQDGTKVTAKDVKYTIEKALNAGGYLATGLLNFKNAELANNLSVIRIQLHKPNPRFLLQLTDPSLSILKFGDSGKTMNGSGPYRLKSISEKLLQLEPNPFYVRRKIALQNIDLPIMAKSDAISSYLSGAVDDLYHFYLSKPEILSLKSKCQWTFDLLPTFRFIVIKTDTNMALGAISKRQCVQSLLNRDELISSWDAGQPKMTHLLPRGVAGGNLVPEYSDLKSCNTEILDDLVRETKNTPIRISGFKASPNSSAIIVSLLAKAKVNATVVVHDSITDFLNSFSNPNIDLYAARFTPRTADIESMYSAFLGNDPFFPSSKKAKTMINLNQNKFEGIPNHQDRFLAIAASFNDFAKKGVFMPVHQFEYAGCLLKKWNQPKLPLNGFIHQDMSIMIEIK